MMGAMESTHWAVKVGVVLLVVITAIVVYMALSIPVSGPLIPSVTTVK